MGWEVMYTCGSLRSRQFHATYPPLICSFAGHQLCSIPFWQWPTGMPSSQKKHFLASALAPHIKVSSSLALEELAPAMEG